LVTLGWGKHSSRFSFHHIYDLWRAPEWYILILMGNHGRSIDH
jgi:hypothetical protein